MKKKRYTHEERVAMRVKAQDMAEEGHSYAEIATALNVPITHVRAYLIASDRPRSAGRIDPVIKEKAFGMFQLGRTALSVSICLNVHQTTANRWLKEFKNSMLQPA